MFHQVEIQDVASTPLDHLEVGSGQTVVIEPDQCEEKACQVCQCPSEFGVCILTAVGAPCHDCLSSLQFTFYIHYTYIYIYILYRFQGLAGACNIHIYIYIGFKDWQVHASCAYQPYTQAHGIANHGEIFHLRLQSPWRRRPHDPDILRLL